MVLDESALEAMLARQRAAERSHEHAPAVRTVKTDEFEVYERQPEATPRPPDPRPAQPATQVRPTTPARTPTPVPQGTDFEELPGREAEAPPPAWQAGDRAPPAPAWPTDAPADPVVSGAGHTAPTADHAAPTVQAAAPPTRDVTSPARRPQVWPPIRPERAAPTAPASSPQPAPMPGSASVPASTSVPEPLRTPVPTPTPAQIPAPAPRAASAAATPPVNPAAARGTDPVPPRSHAPDATGAEAGHGTPAGNGCRLAIVQALFNAEITDAMTEHAVARAASAGAQVTRYQVPGVYDLPLTVQHLARRKDVDAIVVIGCVVQGQTKHDELITFTTAKTLQEISLATDTPIGLGITGPGMTWQQAQARIGNGAHAVDAALVMWRALQAA